MSNSSAIPIDWRRGRAVETRAGERDLADGTLAHISEGIAGATGEQFFRSLVKHLANALAVRYAFVTECVDPAQTRVQDRKSTRLNSSHGYISYAVFCLKK